ncbi:MAG: translation initiation factor aIF-1A [Desulfurococcales archaeon]|nr:translation initiation factor aIF-1A [Desulfurococcales archaeon]
MARRRGGRRREGEGGKKEVPLPSEEEGTILCVIQRVLGAGWVEAMCTDGKVYKAWIPGKMRRRVWMHEGDVILLLPWGVRDRKDADVEKGEVVYRYARDEVRKLIETGVLPEEFLEEVGEEL